MRLADVPVIGELLRSGVGDQVFRWLLLAGPAVIAVIAVSGRRPATVGLVVAYLLVFVANVLRNGLGPRR